MRLNKSVCLKKWKNGKLCFVHLSSKRGMGSQGLQSPDDAGRSLIWPETLVLRCVVLFFSVFLTPVSCYDPNLAPSQSTFLFCYLELDTCRINLQHYFLLQFHQSRSLTKTLSPFIRFLDFYRCQPSLQLRIQICRASPKH